jgi:hypothetical protein
MDSPARQKPLPRADALVLIFAGASSREPDWKFVLSWILSTKIVVPAQAGTHMPQWFSSINLGEGIL